MERASFKREAIREILGDAYTDDIGTKLVTLHRSVLDPVRNELDEAKADAARYKDKAEKADQLQKDLDAMKGGEDWKGKYEQAQKDLEDFKGKIARDADVAKIKAAHKKLLIEEGISEKAVDSILNATDYSKAKLKKDSDELDDATKEGLKKETTERWAGFRVSTRQRGERVDNPPSGTSGMTKEEIMKIKDTSQRQEAIRQNLDLFQKG